MPVQFFSTAGVRSSPCEHPCSCLLQSCLKLTRKKERFLLTGSFAAISTNCSPRTNPIATKLSFALPVGGVNMMARGLMDEVNLATSELECPDSTKAGL